MAEYGPRQAPAGSYKRRMVQTSDGSWIMEGGGVYNSLAAPRAGTGSKVPVNQTASRNNNWAGNLTGTNRDAAAALIALFESYGLGSLAPKIVDYVKKGYGSDAIMLELQETDEWRKRFAANKARRDAGLSVLNPAEYLATERAYRQVLQEYGIPKGFYDSTSDFEKFIANDMSPSELQGRVQAAVQYINTTDSPAKEALRRLYGLGSGDLAAYALDPSRSKPLLEKQMKAVSIAAEAQRQGLGYTRGKSEYFADLGITAEQARQGYSTIAEYLPALNELGSVYGQSFTQGSFEDEVFEGKNPEKRKKLASQERASFSGSSRGSVGQSSSGY